MSITNGSGDGKAGTVVGMGSRSGGSRSRPPVGARTALGARASKEPRRRQGVVAEEAQLRARVELARALGDPSEERASARRLAELLAARDVELDLAVELAFRALASSDDPSLRHQLAGWLEGLGEPALAASELRKLAASASGREAAPILVRIGVLHARAGDPVGAQEALLEAAERDPEGPLPLELLGAVAGWAAATHGAGDADLDVDGFPGPRRGAEAYVQAARRRAAAGDADGEIEDLLRAVELDPSSPVAAAALTTAHAARGRDQAADQVMVEHARSLDARERRRASSARAGASGLDAFTMAAEVHAQRRESAIAKGQLGRALGAALDEGLDAALEGPGADAIDDLLARASAYELLAVRLELRAEREGGRRAAVRWAELGRLLSGVVAAPERAIEMLARAVAADAESSENVHGLRALGLKAGDPTWIGEALVRGVMGARAHGALEDNAARLAAAHELAAFADDVRDPLLAGWAFRVMSELDPADARARSGAARHERVVAQQEEELEAARKALASCGPAERPAALSEVARLARKLPDASRELARVLVELTTARLASGLWSSEDEPLFAEAVRVSERVGDFEGIAALCRVRLGAGARAASSRVRGVLVSALRRAGDLTAAAEAARDLVGDATTRWTCSVAWATAAVAGDRATRARALAAIAPGCGRDLVGILSAVAADALADVGDREGARRAAELACRGDDPDVRALVVLARVATVADGRVAQVALERAAEHAGPSAALCERLAEVLEHLGEPDAALAWTRRRVALRPGDPAATHALVERAVIAGDAGALVEALTWLTPQPQPGKELAERVAAALDALGALDPARAKVISRRALDLLGPRHVPLRRAIEQVADAARDSSLRASVAERWIAAGAPAGERGPLLFEIAAYYEDVGDAEAELHAYARAAREAVDLSARERRIDELGARSLSPDAELWRLEALAEASVDRGELHRAAEAFRELGAALWDMADDRPRAVQAWLRGAHGDSARGYETLRRDLATFADAQYAVDCLSELVEREGDRVRSGVIATQAARAALDVGAHVRALGLAKLALERDPGHADALETAETACTALARVGEMSGIYDQVARRARGRFGRRAAHHRAARFFEAGGIAMMALKHAAQAFIAVPSEGTTLGLLERTASKAQRVSVAVRTVEHVAELARSTQARAGWLLRAASMTTRDLEGMRQRLELLLKATVLVPSPAALDLLAEAAREVVTLAPEDSVAVALRLERAGDQLAKGLEGPDGARIAITFVDVALSLFADGEWAWRSLERALGADADVDEYTRLVVHAPALAKTEEASAALARTLAEVEKPYSNVGHALLRLIGAIAGALGEKEARAKVLVRAAEKEYDDDAIVVEADDALRDHPDDALEARLSRRVKADRRTEALQAIATKALERGDAAEAVRRLERAAELAPADLRDEVARQLGDALALAGRGEDALVRELARQDMPRPERALRWAELARVRQERGDAAGAAEALVQAATEEPTGARWAAAERAAEAAGREDLRVDALQHLASLARTGQSSELLAVLKRLARAEGARGALAGAEAAWREVMAIDASDEEADVALEALLVARGSYDELAEHLVERRARLSKSTAPDRHDKLRAVRLRRAAILEQRLGRLEDACAELEQVLLDDPNHPSALRWLADLYERAGEPRKALPALERLFAAATEEIEYVNLGTRRVRALVAAGEIHRAKQAIGDLRARAPSVIRVAEARVDVARATQEPDELGDALVDLARVSVDEPRVRSELLVEAAQAAARGGKNDLALARARDAARLSPDSASTQLFARGLEYRLRGSGTRDEAFATISSLERIVVDGPGASHALEPEDLALRAFLLAEAEDAARGPGAGEETLRQCFARIGLRPLVALGLAERAAVSGRHGEAYRFFTEAVYGSLLGLRAPGRVALAAAQSASLAGDVAATQRFLAEAAKHADSRVEALRRMAREVLSRDELPAARAMVRGLAETLAGGERAEILAELARVLLASSSPADRLDGDRTMREAIDHAEPEVATQFRVELEAFRGRTPSHAAMAAVVPTGPKPARLSPVPVSGAGLEDKPGSTRVLGELASAPVRVQGGPLGAPELPPAPPPLVVDPDDDLGIVSVRHPPLGVPGLPVGRADAPARVKASEPPARMPSESPAAPADKVANARARLLHGSREEAERLLSEALAEGSVEAADLLDDLLEGEPTHRAVLIKVRRQAVELEPGNVERLTRLRDAARADQNTNYVRAIEHVLRAFDEAPVAPPPLSAQNTQPGILSLLTRHSREPEGEACGIVWEGAPAVFAKSAAAAGMTGLERVVPGPSSALTRVYEVALRLLDMPRFALFHKRTTTFGRPRQGELPVEDAPLTSTVALTAPASAVLSGEGADDTPDLRWVVGQALSCVLPENALVLGLPANEVHALWTVLVAAFGPPGAVTVDRKDAQLADMLWQTLAPRTQRRLKELLASADPGAVELIVERARQSGRRVGMFLTGDFAHAVRRTLADFPGADPADLARAGGLERACRTYPAVADLLRLAVRPEYADARWHLPTPAAQRLLMGKLPPV